VRLSVIIPTLNEESVLAATLESVRRAARGCEILVVDGGSHDRTLDVAGATPGVHTLSGPRGRGPQMNVGAAAASGDVFLFLHADTHLPPDAGRLVASVLVDPRVAGGSFFLGFDSDHPILWLSSIASRLNVRWATFGDQAFFFRRTVFEQVGGFAPLPLFEDVDLQARVRRVGRCVKIQRPVTSSARRFLRVGVIRQQARNAFLLAAYHLGVSPFRLAAWYER
jgi:rSAM/selenodomain-associated transferase 2